MKCPVCLNPSTVPALTGTDFLFETTRRTFKLNACNQCRSLFLNPLPHPDEIAGFYPTQYWWNASRPGLLKRLEGLYRNIALHDHIQFICTTAQRSGGKQPVRVLDVGCGSGTLIGLLKNRGFDVLGVDMSNEASEVAARDFGVRVVVGTLNSAKFEPGSFEIVTLFHVLEHVTNPRELLAEVRRLIEPNGAVIVQVPNIDSWQFRWFGARWYGLDIPRHVIDYSERSLSGLLTESGFMVKCARHFNFRDNAPALVSSLFPWLDPVSRSVRQRQRHKMESAIGSWLKHLTFLALVVAAYPIALVEALSGHGATIMVEARKK